MQIFRASGGIAEAAGVIGLGNCNGISTEKPGSPISAAPAWTRNLTCLTSELGPNSSPDLQPSLSVVSSPKVISSSIGSCYSTSVVGAFELSAFADFCEECETLA